MILQVLSPSPLHITSSLGSSRDAPVPCPGPGRSKPSVRPKPPRKRLGVERRESLGQLRRRLFHPQRPRRRRPRHQPRVALERRVRLAGEHAQPARSRGPQRVLREHSVDGPPQRRRRVPGALVARRALLEPAREARVPPVELVVPLAAREGGERGVLDDDDVAAATAAAAAASVDGARGEGRLVLALEDARELRREAADDLVLGVDEAEADLGGVPGEGDALFLFLVWFRGTWSGGRERALTEKWSRSTKPDRQKKGISSCFSSVVFRRSLLLDCSSITSTAKESTHSTKRAMFQNLERDAWTGAGLRNVRVFAKRNHRLDQDKLLSLLSPYPQRVARRHFSSNCSGKRRLHRESVRALSFSRAISVCSSERAK